MLSVVTVLFNSERFVRNFLDSYTLQSYHDFEIIIVDNNPDDREYKIAQSYNKSAIKIYKNKINLGYANGINKAIEKSKGEFVLIVNIDSWVKPDFLEKIMNSYTKGNLDVVAPYGKNYEERSENEIQFESKLDPFGYQIYVEKTEKSSSTYLTGACILTTKKIYQSSGGFDSDFFMYYEDTDWCLRLLIYGYKIGHIPDIPFHHFTGGSITSGIQYRRFYWRNKNIPQMLIKNYSFFTLIWIIPIYIAQNIIEMIFFILTLKPIIALSYIQGWSWIICNLPKILQKRKNIQMNRKVNDSEIIRSKMYFGFAKLYHLLKYAEQKSIFSSN